MIRVLLVATAITATAWATAIGAAAAGTADPLDAPCTEWNADSSSCYYPNCTAAHNAGEGDIPKSSPHYCPEQDRDNDGIACEWLKN